MQRNEERTLRKALLFMNSRKAESNLNGLVGEYRQRCIPYGIDQTEEFIDRSLDRDADRNELIVLLMMLQSGNYDVLIVRELHELAYDEADLEAIMNEINYMDVDIFELDTMMYRFNNYG